jgi:hypothetical protein
VDFEPAMTFYPQCRLIHKGHRLHGRINNLLITTAAITISVNYIKHKKAEFARGHVANAECKQMELTAVLPVYGPVEAALAGIDPDTIHVDFYIREPAVPPMHISVWAAGINKPPDLPSLGFVSTMANLVAPIFVEFFENYKGWIGNKYGSADKWPPVWQFGRLVRNCASHGGKIHILNPNAKPVSWYGLTYSHANNGQNILTEFKSDLAMGDLIVLMFEMSDLLDQEGCPP